MRDTILVSDNTYVKLMLSHLLSVNFHRHKIVYAERFFDGVEEDFFNKYNYDCIISLLDDDLIHTIPTISKLVRGGCESVLFVGCKCDWLPALLSQMTGVDCWTCPNEFDLDKMPLAFDDFFNRNKKSNNYISTPILTWRELSLFELFIAGYKNIEIATKMELSEKTISTHKVNIQRKLSISSLSEIFFMTNFLCGDDTYLLKNMDYKCTK